MKKEFINSRKLTIMFFLLVAGISIFYFSIFNVPVYAIIIYTIIWLLIATTYLVIEYNYKFSYYRKINDIVERLDKKYIFLELNNENPDFYEARLMLKIIDEVNKAAIRDISRLKAKNDEYEEYIEIWVHEIKMPITTINLMIENMETNQKIKDEMKIQIKQIEEYVTQALYFSKVDRIEKDYVISKIKLKDIVSKVINKNAKEMILKNMVPKLHDLEKIVTSDTMWLEYLINQVIQNSIKYNINNQNGVIEIYAKEENKIITLYIKDNSCGIDREDIDRIFEKGFTGNNGRLLHQKSTGLRVIYI